jgi:hypothetical protein
MLRQKKEIGALTRQLSPAEKPKLRQPKRFGL